MGDWIIQGADKETGEPRTWGVNVATEAQARAWAQSQGIYVESVMPLEEDSGWKRSATLAADDEPRHRITGIPFADVTPGTAFKLGFYGAFGAACAWAVVSMLVLVFYLVMMKDRRY